MSQVSKTAKEKNIFFGFLERLFVCLVFKTKYFCHQFLSFKKVQYFKRSERKYQIIKSYKKLSFEI